jgi:ATP-dependent helicase/nuclease subunit A
MTAIPNDATNAQILAADPGASTWLSANAGSGKTRVLTDRVARMLLRGVAPQRILCLTYTKAAASEMQNRLFKRLGSWAMMPSVDLQRNLAELGVHHSELTPQSLDAARSLFAKAIETPGGLKIQTIHSFCSSLLRRFPLEAGVSPAFTEMDDRTGKLLRADILEQVAEQAPAAMTAFAAHFTGDDTDSFLQEITKRSQDFATPLDEVKVRKELGLGHNTTATELLSSVFLGGEDAMLARIQTIMSGFTGSRDTEFQHGLAALKLNTASLDILAAMEPLFLTKSGPNAGQPKPNPPTKAAKKAFGPDEAQFDQLRERVAAARETRISLAALDKTIALHKFASEFLPRLTAHKEQRGWLDFDDLILRARDLLTDQRVASWVLFRLDGGIDHVLVDEAQDTSPAQWDVVKLLTKEFFSDESERGNRTIFVVGDQKQSIYSFQGADPAQFDANRAYFEAEMASIGDTLQRQDLRYSFRSAAPILALVDASFPGELSNGMGDLLAHIAFKEQLPGRVDIWPWIDGEKSEEAAWDKDWFDPVDTVGSDHHTVQLADQIAEFIAERMDHGQITQIDQGQSVTRRIEAGDFLILVQRRSPLFHEIIRACKALDLPMAGADRLRVGGELGVKDLTALLKYLATPEDDLSLAAVLRSPLCGLSEAQLYNLAQGRGNLYLRKVLEQNQDTYPIVYAMLQDLRKQADYLRPYELLERVLTNHNGREKFAARLGPEAEEGIAALLDLSLQYESADVPSLTGFLTWLEADEVEIKRQMDGNKDKIRVMTVHGAKGLEAPIVLLPDTGTPQNKVRDDIIDAAGTAMWKAKSGATPALQTDSSDHIKTRQAEERMRLLYVAITRAESWLVVCGAGQKPRADGAAWYPIIEAGIVACGAVQQGKNLRLDTGTFPLDLPERTKDQVTTSRTTLPDWATSLATAKTPAPTAISPSDLGGAKALSGQGLGLSEDEAKARGTAIHALLEHLPNLSEDRWTIAASAIIGDVTIAGAPSPLDVATSVLKAPTLAHIFAPDTLAEVDITGHIPSLGAAPVIGTIDRLIITDTHILAVDFKSNATVPNSPDEIPEGILRQMGTYLALLEQIYPDTPTEIAILWSTTASLMPLPHDIVRSALSRAHIS